MGKQKISKAVFTKIHHKSINLSRFTQNWWAAHHRKEPHSLRENLIKEHILLHNLTRLQAEKVVKLMIRAAHNHDIAERFEDNNDKIMARIYWRRTRTLLQRYYETLLEFKTKK